ncbi:MAG: hypothetical protein Ct9H300mP1_28410 [Planctomycetaceae bacterium]|nr:MAG: hypothetical protein Ct9H300mP1_28410 [Planctomycetaceae bacterium]
MKQPTVDAGQQVDDARDVSQSVMLRPSSRSCLENQVSNDLLFEIVEGLGEVARVEPSAVSSDRGGKCFSSIRPSGIGLVVAFGLDPGLHGPFSAVETLGVRRENSGFSPASSYSAGWAPPRGPVSPEFADRNDVLLGKEDRLDHLVFGHLLGEALDHQDALEVAGDDQIQRSLVGLFERGEDDQLVIDLADSHGRQRSLEGDGGEIINAALAPMIA